MSKLKSKMLSRKRKLVYANYQSKRLRDKIHRVDSIEGMLNQEDVLEIKDMCDGDPSRLPDKMIKLMKMSFNTPYYGIKFKFISEITQENLFNDLAGLEPNIKLTDSQKAKVLSMLLWFDKNLLLSRKQFTAANRKKLTRLVKLKVGNNKMRASELRKVLVSNNIMLDGEVMKRKNIHPEVMLNPLYTYQPELTVSESMYKYFPKEFNILAKAMYSSRKYRSIDNEFVLSCMLEYFNRFLNY